MGKLSTKNLKLHLRSGQTIDNSFLRLNFERLLDAFSNGKLRVGKRLDEDLKLVVKLLQQIPYKREVVSEWRNKSQDDFVSAYQVIWRNAFFS